LRLVQVVPQWSRSFFTNLALQAQYATHEEAVLLSVFVTLETKDSMSPTQSKKQAGSQEPSHAFDVFLSYSRKDNEIAARLENALESYRFPKSLNINTRNLNVFRDESDIAAADDYHRTIDEQVRTSAKLVVVCSPDARKSKYVEDEIRRFIETHHEQDIIPILVRGKANNETTDEDEKAFPEILCENRMPLAANFLGWDMHKGKLHKGPFRSSFYAILAGIKGIERRKLEQIDEKNRTRRLVLAVSAASVIILILSVALVFAVISQRRAVAAAEAEKIARQEAVAQKQVAEQRLYVANMNLAQRADEAGDLKRLSELLEAHLVTPATQAEDSRSFYWYYLWHKNRNELATFKGHSYEVRSVAFSPDGKLLASGNRETVKLWEISTGQELATFGGHSDVWSVAFSPDGKTLASASMDRTVKLWDINTRQELVTLRGHSAQILSVDFSPDGKTLASASEDSTVKLWDISTRTELTTLKGYWVAFGPDGKTIALVSFDRTVTLWDTSVGQELAILKGHSDLVRQVDFSPDGKKLVTSSNDGTVKLWDTTTGRSWSRWTGIQNLSRQ
jgi:hypothetical protein